nr:glycerol-3-phosphate 1-O-acyltransferase PlsY [Selenomonas massiliensis]
MSVEYIITAAAAYLIGSIPSGLILGKLFWHTDLREHGSHNIGATNAWRTLGKGAGIAVFIADSLKGQAGVMLGLSLVGTPLAAVVGGLLAIIGHSFSLFLRFHGGKGVATSLGVLSMLMGDVTFMLFVLWFTIVYVTRYVSLGSVVAGGLAPILAALFGYPMEYLLFTAIAAVLVIVRHRENIKRLMNGTENKI